MRFIEDNWLDGRRLGGGSLDAEAGSIKDMFDFGHGRRNEQALARSRNRHRSVDRTNGRRSRSLIAHDEHSRIVWLLGAGLSLAGAVFAAEPQGSAGENPHPIHLIRSPVAPLSAMAQLGRQVFYDASLSSSGKLSCASCHSPQHAYGPPTDGPVMLGGPSLSRQGARAVPSLTYLERQPSFSIGPDDPETETVDLTQMAVLGQQSTRARKTATQTARVAANIVPQGGLFWDGRADTLQAQATSPAARSARDGRRQHRNRGDEAASRAVCEALHRNCSARSIFRSPQLLVSEAMFAVARYQIEEPSFHPYTSKFDYWLEGKARLSDERNARLSSVQRSGQGQLRRLPYFAAKSRRIAAAVYRSSV